MHQGLRRQGLRSSADIQTLLLISAGIHAANLFTHIHTNLRWIMKVFFCLTLALVLILPAAFAQPAPIITVTDTGCQPNLGCPPNSFESCTSATFSVRTEGDYYLDAWTVCQSSTQCWGCMSCAVIYTQTGSTITGYCSSRDCANRDCNNTCTVHLKAGVVYTLSVCLEPCPRERDCGNCARDCIAGACVRVLTSAAACY
jgi:hypothetical protein